jgi:hypothetical protein
MLRCNELGHRAVLATMTHRALGCWVVRPRYAMSLIRILLGVIIGGCIVAGLLAAAVRFPTVAMFVMFGAAGDAFFAVAYRGLRTGVIGARRSRYERNTSPFGYWFFVFFYAFIGIVILGYAVGYLLYRWFARN